MFSKTALIILFLAVLTLPRRAESQTKLTISSAPRGVVLGAGNTASFGTLNGLAIGAPAAGLTAIALTNGALYFTPYRLTIQLNGNNSHTATVTAIITNQFTHPAAFVLQSCPTNLSCTAANQYSTLSTTTNTTVANVVGEVTVTAGLGLFLPDNNGGTAFTGGDTARISLTMTDNNSGKTDTQTIDITVTNLQNAVRLTLGTAAGGLAVTSAADYSMNFGNVNGLGIGPAAGLTTVAAAGGIIYSTPYLLQPAFTDQSSANSTIKVTRTTNFAHPAVLQLNDAAASGGPFTQITAAPITITTTAASRSSITRFLGLFVSNTNNGVGFFTGADSATLTFTLTVP